MGIVLICFVTIFGTHYFFGNKIETNNWSFSKTLLYAFLIILLSVFGSILIHQLFPIILSTLIMSTVLQIKFLKQPKKA